MEGNNKKNKTKIVAIATIIAIAIVSIFIYVLVQYTNGIELTQLANQGSRQMMGYIIKNKDNSLIVIDGGTEQDSENLKKYISQANGTVNYWFITHAHDDHIGAMVKLLEQNTVKIENIVCSLNEIEWYQKNEETRANIVERLYNTFETHSDINIREVNIGDNLTIGNIWIEILGIKNPEIIQNPGNNQSMVFKVHVNDKSILFLGDLGVEASAKLIKTSGDKLQSYAVQMAHHGQAGVTKEVYELVKPKICLWPTPDWLWDNNINNQGYNTGIWRTIETREWMEELNVETNYVEKDGDITIKIW